MIEEREIELLKICYSGKAREEELVEYFSFLASRLKKFYFKDVDDVDYIYVDELSEGTNAEYSEEMKAICVNRERIREYHSGKIEFAEILNTFCHEYWHHIQSYTDLENVDINDELKETLLKSKKDYSNDMRLMDERITMRIMKDIMESDNTGLVRRFKSLDNNGRRKLAEDIKHSNYLHLSYEEDARKNAIFLHTAILDDYKSLVSDDFLNEKWYKRQLEIVNRIKVFDTYYQKKYYKMYDEFSKSLTDLTAKTLVKLANKTESSVRKVLKLRSDNSWDGLQDEKEELIENLRNYSVILKNIIDKAVDNIVEKKTVDECLAMLEYSLEKKQHLLVSTVLGKIKESNKYTSVEKKTFYDTVYESVMKDQIEMNEVDNIKDIFNHEQGVSICDKLMDENKFYLVGEFCKRQAGVDKKVIADKLYTEVISYIEKLSSECKTYKELKKNYMNVQSAVKAYESVYRLSCKNLIEYQEYKEKSSDYARMEELRKGYKKLHLGAFKEVLDEFVKEGDFASVKECLLEENSINIRTGAAYFMKLVGDYGVALLKVEDKNKFEKGYQEFKNATKEMEEYIGRVAITPNLRKDIEKLDNYGMFLVIIDKLNSKRMEQGRR